MSTEAEKPSATSVEGHKFGVGYKEELEVVPIEQEAIQDAYHVHLSWRSWVRSI